MQQHGPTLRPRHELFRWPLLAALVLLLLAIVSQRLPRMQEPSA
jgi:Ca-activated chloride channel family protein